MGSSYWSDAAKALSAQALSAQALSAQARRRFPRACA